MLFLRVLFRLLNHFFRAVGKATLGFFRFLTRHERALGFVVIVVLSVVAVTLLLNLLNVNIVIGEPATVSNQASLTATSVTVTPSPTARVTLPAAGQVSLTEAPLAPETFLQGEVHFDATKVWDSLNADLHTNLQGQGEDQAYFDQQLTAAKNKGRQYIDYQFIGSYKSEAQSQVCFYVLRFSENNQTIVEPFTFWLDEQGKISQFATR
jgi:hypothetical protein